MRTALSRPALLFAALAAAGGAHAQQSAEPVFAGSRVRITTTTESRRVVGKLDVVSADSVVVLGRRRQALALNQVAGVERSSGKARWKWALVGAIAGAALGAAIWKAEPKTDLDIYEDEYEAPGRLENALTAGLGAAALGALFAPERWRPASLSP